MSNRAYCSILGLLKETHPLRLSRCHARFPKHSVQWFQGKEKAAPSHLFFLAWMFTLGKLFPCITLVLEGYSRLYFLQAIFPTLKTLATCTFFHTIPERLCTITRLSNGSQISEPKPAFAKSTLCETNLPEFTCYMENTLCRKSTDRNKYFSSVSCDNRLAAGQGLSDLVSDSSVIPITISSLLMEQLTCIGME